MSNSGKGLVCFGAFGFDREESLLFRDGELVPLPPKALRTLAVLIDNAGRLMAKDELMRAIWPDSFVEEHNLTLNIHLLRKALNAPGSPERYIETVPRRGYRFIAPLQHASPASPRVPADAYLAEPDRAAVGSRRPRATLWFGLVGGVLGVALAGTAASRLIGRHRARNVGPDLVRLTDNVADDHQPDVSPDGQHIVFVSNRDGGKGEIYVMNADGTDLRNLTNDPSNDDTPAWSPDGRQIAFQSDRRGPIEIYVMGADGSRPTPLAPGARAAWSPDGKQLAYQCLVDGHSEIFVIPTAGGTPRRLTSDGPFNGDPTWSPDGTRIAFTSGVGDLLQIDVMRLDGSGRSTLTRDGNNTLPAWSADGRILFTSDRDGTRSVYVMEDDGTLQHRVEDRGEEAGWWPGGHAIVFQSDRDGNAEIYRLRLTNEPDGAVRLTRNVAIDDYPAWSPDGKWIAFDSNRDGQPNVFVMAADGHDIHNVSRSRASDVQPDWSWDGARIAFASDRAGGSSIYVMNPDGTGAYRVTDGPEDFLPHFSPDGSFVCFTRGPTIWIARLDRRVPPRRLALGASCAWSADGRQIVFDRDQDGAREVYRMPIGGGDPVCVTHNGRSNGGPVPSRDGARVAFNSNQDGFRFGIFVMARDGTTQTRVTGRGTFDEHPTWSPDGHWIAFTSHRDGNEEIYKVAVPGATSR